MNQQKDEGCLSILFKVVVFSILWLLAIAFLIVTMDSHEQRLWRLEEKAGLPHTDAMPWAGHK